MLQKESTENGGGKVSGEFVCDDKKVLAVRVGVYSNLCLYCPCSSVSQYFVEEKKRIV